MSFQLNLHHRHVSVYTCVVVIIDGHCGGVVVTQYSLWSVAAVQGGSTNLRISHHPRVTEVDVEILIFLKDVIVYHADCDL